MTENFLILKRTVTYTSEEYTSEEAGGNGAGYDVIPYPEATSTPDASKTTPTITITPNSASEEQCRSGAATYDIAYNGDGTLYVDYIVDFSASREATYPVPVRIINDNGYKLHIPRVYLLDDIATLTYTIRSTTTDTCNPASATFTITN